MSIRAIIPLKALAAAKGRMAPALDAHTRRDLVTWMATHVIKVCQACDAIDDVLVVAGDVAAAEVGRAAGAQILVVTEPGLSHALDAADGVSATWTTTLVVAADLPDITAEDLLAVLAAADDAEGPVVVVAPTHDGGTGVLLRRPGHVIPTSYGTGSAARHLRLGATAGAATVTVSRDGLARDVDRPEHLTPALARRQRQVVRSGLPSRPNEESACRKAP